MHWIFNLENKLDRLKQHIKLSLNIYMKHLKALSPLQL